MSILLSASTCRADLEHGEHLLKISDYSLHRGLGVGRYIQSSSFTVGGHDWCLHYYPDGSSQDSKDDVAVVLHLTETRTWSWTQTGRGYPGQSACSTGRPSGFLRRRPSRKVFQIQTLLKRAPWTGPRWKHRVMLLTIVSPSNAPWPSSRSHMFSRKPTAMTTRCHRRRRRTSWISAREAPVCKGRHGCDVRGPRRGIPHKLVLAMRSPVFKAALYGPMREKKKDSDRIVIDDMQPAIFKVLLHFIYTDSLPAMDVDLDANQRIETNIHVLVAADRYGMERLKRMCESILCEGLDVESVATTLALADRHTCSGLKDACTRFIKYCTKSKIDGMVASTGYIGLKRSCPETIMEMWEKASRLRKNYSRIIIFAIHSKKSTVRTVSPIILCGFLMLVRTSFFEKILVIIHVWWYGTRLMKLIGLPHE